ncbi:hypothetical protein DTO166G4_1268 [Paecilomyces variotii]|nr:hypothetical protein DTO032I3_1764 [Paecilomyces variotii]KAJ9207239.1 hypothetical protein DTO164E3_513 [Paecilomyces variotii]KAJ9217213.1 hypothetical protein DTO166G4_1268 [Paecilomyces variotii]KAJ9227304.1 hypothetical protein DTO169C6_525 [Paecilomyces variotii]KAJ9242267.1 hypothetical protein DTO166G5_670 [Paecilomyces variotii]
MFSQKIAQQSLRRLAVQQPSAMRLSMAKFASPAAVATGNYMQMRPATSTAGNADPTKLLAQQRLNRPVSPHLAIYRPQITWYLSATHRITGFVLSGGLYAFATAYLVAPLLGWHLESTSIAAAFGALPVAAKFLAKYIVAFPFTLHSFNGIRHLVWDLGRGLTNKQVIKSGWTAVGLAAVTSFILALI